MAYVRHDTVLVNESRMWKHTVLVLYVGPIRNRRRGTHPVKLRGGAGCC